MDVWGAKLGDGSNNIIMQASDDGTQNLVPMTLYYPRPAGVATNLKLTISNEGEAVAWDTSDPSNDDTPVLSDSDSTVTLDAAAGDYQRTLWVGATEGSTTLNDLFFTLAAVTPRPTTGPTTQPTTNPATPIKAYIESLSNPNGDSGNNGDVTGKTRNWLVGQYVDLAVVVAAPPSVVQGLKYSWTVPGSVLHDYISGTTIPLSANNTGPLGSDPHEALNGTQQSEVKFFWVSTNAAPPGFDTDNVSLQIKAAGGVLNLSTTFKVFTPVSTTSVIHPRPTGINPANPKIAGLYGGIFWKANVQTEPGQGFVQGEYAFTQLLRTSGSIRFTDGWQSVSAWGNNFGLDLSFPYPCNVDVDPPTSQDRLGWLTDTGINFAGDTPELPLAISVDKNGDLTKIQTDWVQLEKDFSTSLMYKPPGTNSRWVPLQNLRWSICYRAKADITGPQTGKWVAVPSNWGSSWDVIPATFQPAATEPTWQFSGQTMTRR